MKCFKHGLFTDLLELDSEISRMNILKESDPFLPVLPSPDMPEEPLADGLTTPPVTPYIPPIHFFRKGVGYFHHHL